MQKTSARHQQSPHFRCWTPAEVATIAVLRWRSCGPSQASVSWSSGSIPAISGIDFEEAALIEAATGKIVAPGARNLPRLQKWSRYSYRPRVGGVEIIETACSAGGQAQVRQGPWPWLVSCVKAARRHRVVALLLQTEAARAARLNAASAVKRTRAARDLCLIWLGPGVRVKGVLARDARFTSRARWMHRTLIHPHPAGQARCFSVRSPSAPYRDYDN